MVPTHTNALDMNRTPTPRTHSTRSSLESVRAGAHSFNDSGGGNILVVYIVTDVIYPTSTDFNHSKGNFRIDSVHSSKRTANARAKKIIYDGGQVDGSQYKVDLDKIIEETKTGLFTGIGIGGKGDGGYGSCYARKCQVESKMVDEDSEDESEGSDKWNQGGEYRTNGHNNDADMENGGEDDDVQMG
ncbi:hypothetical protein HBI17_006960 [Parastagonospora nodorum]|nr:hypothetical protein HBI28_164420 [Parastagonospora nodorum]KAH5515803.1 hypothetical protein HBI31_000540 [Parastagonospora nodorum]KAH5528938.1 hypothetical protein HBI29_009380 [Parastagonospora nodorum]KAH5641283.1 hypothetical protein HBI22_060440 [Parastagonospora nodorum]KAH5773738.1 hypothetical protein HBI17_006960 [Parastagonospora nodorum]